MMLRPSYNDLIQAANSDGEVVSSRYSIVIAAARRARQIVNGSEPQIEGMDDQKPLSIAINEIYGQKVKILPEEAAEE